MDAGIVDTINRRTAQLITAQLDTVDLSMPIREIRWQYGAMAETLLSGNEAVDGDCAWLIGMLASRTPGLDFDGAPADGDWENLFSHFRVEILARRDPKIPHAQAAEICLSGMV